MAIKAQTLADFIAEFTHDIALKREMSLPEEELESLKSRDKKMISPNESSSWIGCPTNTDVVLDLFSKLH